MDSIIRISRSSSAPVDGFQHLAELDSAEPSSGSPSAPQPGAALTPRVYPSPAALATEYRRWSMSRGNGVSAALLSVLAHPGER